MAHILQFQFFMKTRTKYGATFFLLVTVWLSLTNANAQGRVEKLKLKSESLAWVLALDPIPGDALFYAGKPVQGTINLVLGGITGAAFYTGLYMYLTEPGADSSCSSSMSCSGFGKRLGAGYAIVGGIPYLSFLIWDAIVGINGVKNHNERVRRQNDSVWRHIQPTFAVTDGGGFVGANIRF